MDSADVGGRRLDNGEQKRRTAFLLLVACIVAAIPRTFSTYHGGIWADESFLLLVIRLPSWGAMLDFLHFHESHPPSFYVLMRLWSAAVGSDDKVLLVLPLLIGIALVPATYWCAAKLFNPGVAVVSSALVAVSPPLIEYSTQLRPYGLLPLLTLFSCYSMVRAIDRGGRLRWIGYAVITALLLYTHNWTFLVVAAQCVAVCILSLRTVPRKRMWISAVLAFGVTGIIFSPWIPAFLYQIGHAGHSPVIVKGPLQFLGFAIVAAFGSFIMALFSSFPDNGFGMLASLVVSAAAASIAAAVWARGLRAPVHEDASRDLVAAAPAFRVAIAVFLIVPLATLALAVAVSPRTNMVIPRCIAMLTPLLLIMIAVLADRVLGVATSHRMVAATTGALTWFIATCIVCDGVLMRSVRSNAREVGAAVQAALRPRDLLIVAPEWYAAPFNHYFAGSVEQIDFPHPAKAGPADFSHVFDRVADPGPLSRLRRQVDDARKAGRRVLVISGRNYVRPLSSDDVVNATTYRSAALLGVVRVNQIRRFLEEEYGMPDSIEVDRQRTRYEELVAYVYQPKVADSSTSIPAEDMKKSRTRR